MNKAFIQLLPGGLSEIKKELKVRLKGSCNLVYYASGNNIREGYAELPFDNVVLIDKSFSDTLSIKDKVITMGLTALEATALFKNIKVKFDAFVCINEGLWEGGGSYPINGNWSLGNILPILKNEYLHIACPGYYGQRKWKKMFNLPQQAVLLNSTDADYLDPTVFSNYYQYGKEFCVWRVSKKPGEPATFKSGSRKVTVQRQNIWEDYDALDSLFVRCSPHEARNLQRVAPKAEIVKNYSFEQILRFCNLYKISKLGLSPWRGGQYNSFFDYLEMNEVKFPYPQELYFYHLHQNDFQQLYTRAGVISDHQTEPGM